jgi:hypothetical protein|tara:strand:+ start:619 stop:852 length:234 start_codon:yes stop_codon:yes gene_type:complete
MSINKQFKQTQWGWVDKDTIAVSWCVDDVKQCCKDLGTRTLSTKKCKNVLSNVLRKHDAEIGINWNVLEHWVQEEVA